MKASTCIIYMLWTKKDTFYNNVSDVNSVDILAFDKFSTHIVTTLALSLLLLYTNNNL